MFGQIFGTCPDIKFRTRIKFAPFFAFLMHLVLCLNLKVLFVYVVELVDTKRSLD